MPNSDDNPRKQEGFELSWWARGRPELQDLFEIFEGVVFDGWEDAVRFTENRKFVDAMMRISNKRAKARIWIDDYYELRRDVSMESLGRAYHRLDDVILDCLDCDGEYRAERIIERFALFLNRTVKNVVLEKVRERIRYNNNHREFSIELEEAHDVYLSDVRNYTDMLKKRLLADFKRAHEFLQYERERLGRESHSYGPEMIDAVIDLAEEWDENPNLYGLYPKVAEKYGLTGSQLHNYVQSLREWKDESGGRVGKWQRWMLAHELPSDDDLVGRSFNVPNLLIVIPEVTL